MKTEQVELQNTEDVDVVNQVPSEDKEDEEKNLVEGSQLAVADQGDGLDTDFGADQAAIIEESNVRIHNQVIIIEPAESEIRDEDVDEGEEMSLVTTIKSSGTNENVTDMSGEETILNVDNLNLQVDFVAIKEDDESIDSLSITSDMDYLLQKNVSTVQSFFTHMTELPRVSEVELTPDDDEDENTPRLTVESRKQRMELLGSFVNPLTGDELSSSKSASVSDLDGADVYGEGEEIEMSSDAEDWLSIASIKSIEESLKKTSTDIEGEIIFKLMPRITVVEEVDVGQHKKEEVLRLDLKQSIERFVENLINTAVDLVEFVDDKAVFVASLDKVKVLKQMFDDVIYMEVERQKNRILNVRAVEYFHKKKMFRAIAFESSKTWVKTFPPYVDALNKLDNALQKEHDAIETKNRLTETENRELEELEELVTNMEREYEDVVNNTIVKVNSTPKWKQYVENSLQKLATERNKISKERICVVKLQHIMADLTERFQHTEFVTPKYTMTNYERISANIVKLGDINDEIIQSINKSTYHYNNMLHLLAHTREKRHIVFCQIQNDNKVFQDVKRDHHALCELLHRSKVIHSNLGTKLSDLSYTAGGLLDKPNLMRDYDNTVDAIEKLNIIHQKLRKEYGELLTRRSTFRRGLSVYSKKTMILDD